MDTIKDPTNVNLEYALLDQRVAGIFGEHLYAYVPVNDGDTCGVGIAVGHTQGYSPIVGLTFKSRDEASKFCDGMNIHIGLSLTQAAQIIATTMRHPVASR